MRLKKESGERETSDDAHMDIKTPKCTVFEKEKKCFIYQKQPMKKARNSTFFLFCNDTNKATYGYFSTYF